MGKSKRPFMDRISINFKVVVTSGLDPSGRSNVRGAGVALVRPYGFFFLLGGRHTGTHCTSCAFCVSEIFHHSIEKYLCTVVHGYFSCYVCLLLYL